METVGKVRTSYKPLTNSQLRRRAPVATGGELKRFSLGHVTAGRKRKAKEQGVSESFLSMLSAASKGRKDVEAGPLTPFQVIDA